MGSKKEQLTIFPDTNVLLHYPSVDQIDWLKWCNCKSIKIVLCLQVVDELDRKKSDPTMGERAKNVIKKIKKIIDSNSGHIKDETLLEIYNKDLNYTDISADEAIVQEALDYQSNHQGENLYIMTEDLGMQLRCEQRIRTIEPNREKRLPSPNSALKQENIKLMNQIAKLQNQIPVLSLILTRSGENMFNSPAPFRVEFNAVSLEDENTFIQEEMSKCNMPSADIKPLVASMFPKPDYTQYRQELSEWVKKYNEAMEKLFRSFAFSLHIKNTGRLPAENVVVFLNFPKVFQFIVCGNEHYGKTPTIPDKPEPPRPGLAGMIGLDALSRINPYSDFMIPTPNIHGPWVQFSEDNDNILIQITIKKIKHHLVESFECTAGLLSFEHASTFDLEYIIMADNMPQKIEGKIPFIFGQR